jgi:type IV pilus assembly protein PilW
MRQSIKIQQSTWLSKTPENAGTLNLPPAAFLKSSAKQTGFSLIELLVAMIIGLIVSMAVYSVLSVGESRKRSTTSVNDIDQAGAYALYQIDQAVRNAGSGLGGGFTVSQGTASSLGCPLQAARNGTQILPAAGFPAPFTAVNNTIRLAPVIIINDPAGANGDIIITMSGSGGLGETPTRFLPTGGSLTQLNLQSVIGFRANDKSLLLGAVATQPCFISQVSNTFVPAEGISTVDLAGEYYQGTINGNQINTANTFAINLGKTPAFTMLGVGANNTLFMYDLLKASAPTATAANPSTFIENTYALQAMYGVDNDGNAAIASITWVPPTGLYSVTNLLDGSAAANARLASIVAIRVGLVLRTDLDETKTVSQDTVTLFGDTANPIDVALNPTTYRYRSFESTIPLRNNLL